jgi:hypothetical protein
LYFDDWKWTIRYLMIDTGKWLPSREVLVSPAVAGRPDGQAGDIPVDFMMEQVRNSPNVDTEQHHVVA